MILTGPEIARQVEKGHISLQPFNPARLTTNSYDLQLGDTLLSYTSEVLDPRIENPYIEELIPDSGYHFRRHQFALGSSVERVGSDYFVPIIHARSSYARLGLFVHVTADLIDLGSLGRVTFQLFATSDVVLLKGARVAQVSFWKPEGLIHLYNGKYQHSDGPRPSKAFMDETA